jgi:hypothetical protein
VLANKEVVDSLNKISQNLENINDTLKVKNEEAKPIITEDDFKKAQETLLGYYGDLQSSQGTRLIGFAVGLFALLQIAQYPEGSSHAFNKYLAFNLNLSSIFAGFKVAVLFGGCLIILYFILRAIFRYSLFGYLPSKIITARKEEAELVLAEWKGRADLKGKEPTSSALYALNTSIFRKVHDENTVFRIKSRYFYSVLDPNQQYQGNERAGKVILLFLAVVLSGVLIAFLW